MLTFIIGSSAAVITLGAFLAFALSEKSTKHILAEIRYEIVYNILGSKALLEDLVMKDKNKCVGLPMATGKIAVVTGGARGIGVEVVRELVKRDAHVVIGCRNVSAGEKLFEQIRAKGIRMGNVKVFRLDLSSIESVRSFAEAVKQQYPKIHLLVNNAGKMFGPYIETVDGYESQFETNYLGHFLLTHLLLPQLKAGGTLQSHARVVNVTSCAHMVGEINFEDINFKQQYIASAAYAQSKLAQVLFANYLNSSLKVEGAPVSSCSVHPGIVDTELFDGTYLKMLTPHWFIEKMFKTPEQGAASILYASLSPNLERLGGVYISNCQVVAPVEASFSKGLQARLFDFTKGLLSIKEFGKE